MLSTTFWASVVDMPPAFVNVIVAVPAACVMSVRILFAVVSPMKPESAV